MVNSYRNRCFCVGDVCKVYRNLNNRKFSIVATTGQFKGKVVAHADCLTLTNVTFKISQASRDRALREKTRNVHAFSIGTIESFADDCHDNTLEVITYRPFERDCFYRISDNQPIECCSKLYLNNGMAFSVKQLKSL